MLWTIVGISLAAELWVRTCGDSNIPFYHLYILVEYLFLLKIFQILLTHYVKNSVWKNLNFGFIVIWIFNVLLYQGWHAYPDYIHALEAFIILVLVLTWFTKMLKEKVVKNPEKTFEFWMCSGQMLFFSGNFLLFLFSNFLLSADDPVYMAVWIIHLILNLMLYSIYTIAIIWVKRTIK